jgi:hypothetical protein
MHRSNTPHSCSSSLPLIDLFWTDSKRGYTMRLPRFLMTALDAELPGDRQLTYEAEFMCETLRPDSQKIMRNIGVHHKDQKGLAEYLRWLEDHPNQNPPTKLAEGILEPVDPTKPSQVRCPRKACTYVDTPSRVQAHMFMKTHAILPVFHCQYNNQT